MNILVLHRMGNPGYWRHSVADLELCLPRYAPEHRYLVHDASLPLPDFVRDLTFDGVVLGPTFLGARCKPALWERILEEFSFVGQIDAYKIARPQDDYDCAALLDGWLTDWRVDETLSVLGEHWALLYPSFRASGGTLVPAYTGYITDELERRAANPRAHAERRVDVRYRAARLPPNFGRLGTLKAEIATVAARTCDARSLRVDISVDAGETIFGDAWLDSLEDARVTLGTPSGSSLLDADGGIRHRVQGYLALHPRASFAEVAASCFSGQDGERRFTAISPRLFEAGLLRTGQVLVPGPQDEILEPGVHYVPVAEDLSDMATAIDAITDVGHVEEIAGACAEALLDCPELRMRRHVETLLASISRGSAERHIRSRPEQLEEAAARYEEHIRLAARARWAADSIRRLVSTRMPRLSNVVRALGGGRGGARAVPD